MQSGAPHSIFGTYVEMMQHASLLKRAVAMSFLTIAAVQSVCRHSHPSPAAAASQLAASAHTVGGVRGLARAAHHRVFVALSTAHPSGNGV
jgi:hypothetical protein